MPPLLAALAPPLVAYLVGAVPFGYAVGRARGVDLFREGSGNVGATNAARVLGRGYGALVFVLDFLKGAGPVAWAVPLADALAAGPPAAAGGPEALRVLCAASAFLGHLFPVYLGFRGGKGVATGAGTVFVLVPAAAALAVLAWVLALFASRFVSLASLVAVSVLVAAHVIGAAEPFGPAALPVTIYLAAGTALVFAKHRANVRRLAAGTENAIGEFSMRRPALRGLHVLALGLWFGGAGFFNFVTAPTIFNSFARVVADVAENGPSDRTAFVPIIEPGAPKAKRDALASALAGSAVGPVFPRYFALQAVCGAVALATAVTWWRLGGVHRKRVWVLAFALATVAAGWPVSNEVSRLRLARFDPGAATAEAARAAFVGWHFASLFLSFVTVAAAGYALALAARLPADEPA